MNCCEEEEVRRQRVHSENIDSQLKEDHSHVKKILNVLVIGPKNSGKSSIIKQIKIIHGGYNEQERLEEAKNVRATIGHVMKVLITEIDQCNPPLVLKNETNIPKLHLVQDHVHSLTSNQSNFPKEFYECCDALWRDEAIQQYYTRSHHPLLHSMATHFMNHSKLMEIAQDDYLPSDNDIFRVKEWGPGTVHETLVISRTTNLRFLEVNDEQSMRDCSCRWASCIYEELAAVIFVVDVSSFSISIDGDKTRNKLKESLTLFEDIRNNRWLGRVPLNLILFNKTDLLGIKMNDKNISLADHFPEFESFPVPAASEPKTMSRYYLGGIEDTEAFRHARAFFKDLFGKISAESIHNSDMSSCYCHFTNAHNTENVKRIFEACRACIYENSIKVFLGPLI